MPDEKTILSLLTAIADGKTSPDEALEILRLAPLRETIEAVTTDPHRQLRTGFGETVFAEGKSTRTLISAVESLSKDATPVLATRVNGEQAKELLFHFPSGCYCERAGLFSLGRAIELSPPWPREGDLIVMSAGASDERVALEALGTAHFFGIKAAFAPDVGVSGLHRLAPWLSAIHSARIIIVTAGMEGALASVIAGFARCPVLAVPTSVGYGAAKGGYAALLGMLSSCSPGVAVLNIDNGYGAAMFAAKLLAADSGASSETGAPGQKNRSAL